MKHKHLVEHLSLLPSGRWSKETNTQTQYLERVDRCPGGGGRRSQWGHHTLLEGKGFRSYLGPSLHCTNEKPWAWAATRPQGSLVISLQFHSKKYHKTNLHRPIGFKSGRGSAKWMSSAVQMQMKNNVSLQKLSLGPLKAPKHWNTCSNAVRVSVVFSAIMKEGDLLKKTLKTMWCIVPFT